MTVHAIRNAMEHACRVGTLCCAQVGAAASLASGAGLKLTEPPVSGSRMSVVHSMDAWRAGDRSAVRATYVDSSGDP